MKIINKQPMAFLQNLVKSYTEGVYADTPTNRRLGRVGMSYAAYRVKAKEKNPDKSEEQIINNYGFKKGDIVTAILPNGKEVEGIFDSVNGRDHDSITIKVNGESYWTTPDRVILKEAKKKNLSYSEYWKIKDKLSDLKLERDELEEERERIEFDQEDEIGSLGEEEKNKVLEDGNHPIVVKYAKLLEEVDKKLDKVNKKIKTQEDKLK